MSGDWTVPTKYNDRFADAIALLCAGNRPPEQMVLDWFDDSKDSFDLQEFCLAHCPLVWTQGIVVIDAATALADEPGEGVGHEPREM
jgi:hypothetical protein